jgi:poly-gamma-glutamate capsule biosynthesis protein CapA/YwtB (metallophosphatase superfamily)
MSAGFSILFALLFLSTCARQSEVAPRQPPREERTELVIAAIGDVMMPLSIQSVVVGQKDSYGLLFEKVVSDLISADIAFANLETTVDHTVPVSGYPKFNARPDLLAALKKAGVGIVSIANNHAMDAGPDGLIRTIDNLEAAGIRYTGAGRTQAEAERATTATIRGVTIAFLGYTYGTNQRLPRKKNGPRVNILRPESEDDLAHATEAVRKARTSADLVVVSLHWSDEYRTNPTAWQRRAASDLVEAGADVILGHHPHVLQPVESLTARNGRQGLVAFSLGNFISSQNQGITHENKEHARALRGDGIILNIFAVREKGKTSIVRAEFRPTWTLRDKVGEIVLYRPVDLAQEITRLETMPKRTREDDKILKLLSFRMKVITDSLMGKAAP